MSNHSKPIWFITYDGLPDMDPDDALVAHALRKRGYEVMPKIWDDPNVDWSKCEFAVLRSTWDYHRKYEAFLKWLAQPALSHTLWNKPNIVRWNTNKIYLRELEKLGVDIVPTIWFTRAMSNKDVRNHLRESGWTDVVLKPVIGLSTSDIKKLNLKDHVAAETHVMELMHKHDALLQPYMKEVEKSGERSLMFIDGSFSHAIKKAPFQKLAPAGHAGESAVEPEKDELDLAEFVLSTQSSDLLYARVDVVRDEHGMPRLMELELVEPSLFMRFNDKAPELFADAIEARIKA